jgi:hypothetical protein
VGSKNIKMKRHKFTIEPTCVFPSQSYDRRMKATLVIKYSLTNCMSKCNVALLLFLFLSVSFINVAVPGDVSSQDIVIYVDDFNCVADSTPKYDLGDDSVDISYHVTEKCGAALNTIAVQARTTYSLNYSYLRPLTRAPPKVFI